MAMLLAAALSIAPTLLPLFVVLLTLAIIWHRLSHRSEGYGVIQWRSALPWIAFYYLLHVIALAWTSDRAAAYFDLEVKLSLLLFPLFALLVPTVDQFTRTKVLKAYVAASTVAALLCLVLALFRFGSELTLRQKGLLPDDPAYTNHFFESRYALFLHPSYMAMYTVMALALWWSEEQWRDLGKTWNVLVVSLLILAVILCNSKIGWITLGVLGIHVSLRSWRIPAIRRSLLVVMGAVIVVFSSLFLAFPTVSGKFTQALEAAGEIDPSSDRSSDLRRMAWDAATDLVRAHPLLGVGTGDIKPELMAIYAEKGYVYASEKRLNAHGQFIQSAAALGLFGLALLLAALLVPMWKAIRERNDGLLAFLLLCLLNWAVESMLEVQAGVLFFAFFAWLFTLHDASTSALPQAQ